MVKEKELRKEAGVPAIVEFPTIVKEAKKSYGDIFMNEPERNHFAEYLTGLMIASRKTVNGMVQEFADGPDQSCLNRWLTEVDWDVRALNDERLRQMQKDPSTRYHAQGVIAIDNVLVDHDGKLIEDVGKFWDHADKRYLIAHDYLIANYVCSSGKHYPLEFRRFKKREAIREHEAFKDHNELLRELVDWVVSEGIPGDLTWDCYFTNAKNMNHVHAKDRVYVGDLKTNLKLNFQGKEMNAVEMAERIPLESRKPVMIGEEKQWYFTKTIRIPGVDHPVRIVLLWECWNSRELRKVLVTNRVMWEVTRILRVYLKRWRGTETFHRDGKQNLGMGDCQVRDGQGQTRHMYLVFLAYSLLMSELKQSRASEWALTKLSTIGEACRAVGRETYRRTITWVLDRVKEDQWTPNRIHAALGLA